MTAEPPPLLGLVGYISAEAAQDLVECLRRTWVLTVGETPDDLGVDLEKCRRWFDPVAQGQRLRRELADLPELPAELPDPGEPYTMVVGPGKRIVTPEGRCALHLLDQKSRDQSERDNLGWVVGDNERSAYDRMLARLYRDWSRHRLESVVALLTGTTKPLQIPAAGVVIALLVDRCTDESRAMVRFASGPARDVVDRAFFSAVNSFADVLAPSRRGSRDSRLISGWMLYEARRRLGDGLVVEDFHGNQDGKVWIRPDAEDHVIDVVARDLVRGHRAKATPEKFAYAFDALVDGLRGELPSLAGFGLVHERPAATSRLKRRLLDRLAVHLDASRDRN